MRSDRLVPRAEPPAFARMLFALVLLIALAGCSTTSVAPARVPPPAPPGLTALGGFNPRPWRPVLALAPTVDPDPDLGSQLAGLDEAGRLLRAVLTDLQRTDRAQRLLTSIVESLGTLDVKGLYDLAGEAAASNPPETAPPAHDRWRLVDFRGGRSDQRFMLDVGPSAETPATFRDATLARFGKVRGVVALRPDPGSADSDLFNLRLGMEVDLSTARWRAAQRSLTELGTLLQQRPDIAPPTAAGEASEPRFPLLDGASRALALRVLRAWPSFIPLAARFLTAEQILGRRHDTDQDPAEITEIAMRVRLERDPLASSYPGLDGFLSRFEDMLDVRWVIADADNRELLVATFDTRTFRMQLRGALHRGRLVPRDSQGRLHPEDAMDPFAPSSRPTLRTDVVLHVSGVDLAIRNLAWRGRYETRQGFMSLRARMSTPPTVTATGALWDVVPVWLLDAMIPGNLEELAGGFFHTLAGSNGGEGALAELGFAPGPLASRLSLALRGDLEDSGFVGFLMRVFGTRFVPTASVRAEWMHLMNQLLDAFAKDYALLAGALSDADR